MLAGIREILIISTPTDLPNFQKLLGNGNQLGIQISYKSQPKAEGLAQAFTIGEEFIGDEKVALILGDNIFQGTGLGVDLVGHTNPTGALIFGYTVTDPERYGVAEIDLSGNILTIVEKPQFPKSNIAIPGLYFFDNTVVEKAHKVQKSARGELEITSILEMYLGTNDLKLEILPRGTAWLDCGTSQSLNDAGNYIRVIEERQGLKVSCPEEIAWRNGWISQNDLLELANSYGSGEYSNYLRKILSQN
jgi:glucose-1-phosphate thymidylyltransferase